MYLVVVINTQIYVCIYHWYKYFYTSILYTYKLLSSRMREKRYLERKRGRMAAFLARSSSSEVFFNVSLRTLLSDREIQRSFPSSPCCAENWWRSGVYWYSRSWGKWLFLSLILHSSNFSQPSGRPVYGRFRSIKHLCNLMAWVAAISQ